MLMAAATNVASQATLLAFEHLTMKDPSMRADLPARFDEVVHRCASVVQGSVGWC